MKSPLLTTCAIGCVLIGTSASGAVIANGLGTSVNHAGSTYTISAGTQKGGNLFHSLSQLDLLKGETAAFSSSGAGIINIISRITGGPSSIDGTISSTVNGANIYLINPAGIMFGPDTSLNITGSFFASTADYLKLGTNGGIFYADPGNSAVNLTIDPPSAFGFLSSAPAAINMNGSYLSVAQGKDISLVGGNINLTNTNLWSYGGTINLVSVASQGDAVYSGGTFQTQGFSSLGRISVVENRPSQVNSYSGTVSGAAGMDGFSVANLDASSDMGGGRIFIRGGSFYMNGGSIYNDSYGNLPQGITDIAVHGAVTLAGSSITGSTGFNLGTASGAPVAISGATIFITNNTIVNTDSNNGSNGADLSLTATDSITVNGRSHVSTDANSPNALAGAITIHAPTVSIIYDPTADLSNIATVSSSAPVPGAAGAGTITIDAVNSLTLTGNLLSYTVDGKSGTITIRTGALALSGNGLISTRLNNPNNPGNQGKAGDIAITANSIVLNGTGRIESNAISASDGNGGNITINSSSVSLLEQATISTSINNLTGSGGNITINAANSILVASQPVGQNKQIGSIASDTTSTGNAGQINLASSNITVTNGATVSTYGFPGSSGTAGNITVTAGSMLSVDSGAVNTQSASSNGGNIIISAPNIMKVKSGEVTASATAGAGNGGNVTIDAGYLTLNNGLITAQAEFGNGGNLLINVSKMFVKSVDGLLSASSRYGQQGTVVVNAPNTDMAGALAPPAFDIFNLNAFVPKRCVAPDELNASTFRLLGSDGLPAAPENSFPTF